MISVTRDAAWAARLGALAARGGWPFFAFVEAPRLRPAADEDCTVAVLDRAAAGSVPGRAVARLRALLPQGRVALACSDAELGADGAAAGVASGADEVVGKSWTDERLLSRLGALRDAALAAAVRVSSDGTLKASLRSRRVHLLRRERWVERPIQAAEFALLWALLGSEGRPLTRERLLAVLREVAGRDVESGNVSRRALSLRRRLAGWKGTLETLRGGFYRLAPPEERTATDETRRREGKRNGGEDTKDLRQDTKKNKGKRKKRNGKKRNGERGNGKKVKNPLTLQSVRKIR
jgi:DNA-binding response OmpR family regulator